MSEAVRMRSSCRRGLRWFLLGGGLSASLVVAASGLAPLAAQEPRVGREVALTYVARVSRLPAQARQVRVWIPLAETRSGQRIVSRTVRTTVPYTMTTDPTYGNALVYLQLGTPLPDRLEVAIEYQTVLLGGRRRPPQPSPTSDELARQLQPQGLLIIDEEVRERSARATAGKRTRVEQARAIYDHVVGHMTYDKNLPGWGRGDTRRACLLGRGNCTDFHSLFISMARAQGIPARFDIGVLVPQEGSSRLPGYHCWAEFYLARRGWVQVDASEAWKHPDQVDAYFDRQEPDRFLISQGRSLQLMPPQQGGPVNMLFAPYVEVDGVVFGDVEVEVHWLDLTHKEEA